MAEVAGIARLVLAAVFIVAGWTKLSDPSGSQQAVADLGVPRPFSKPVGLVLPFVELAIAIALLVSPWSVGGGDAALVLLGLFIVAIAFNLGQGRRPACNCFGQISSKPIGIETLARNIALAGVAMIVVNDGPGNFVGSWIDRADTVGWVAAGAAAAAIGVMALARRRASSRV